MHLKLSAIQVNQRCLKSRFGRFAGWIQLFLLTVACTTEPGADLNRVPAGFVDIASLIPDAVLDVRYFSRDNFVGASIDGYEAARIYMTAAAAEALQDVQLELRTLGLGIKIFDAYRPQKAVDHFVRWAQNLSDIRMKDIYYPAVDKANLVRDGYIAARSGHSRGSTVDLTLIDLETQRELDMGSGWDFFDPVSWPSDISISAELRANRMRLQSVMIRHGFQPLAEEWWHFTLESEPFPDTYFDFPVN